MIAKEKKIVKEEILQAKIKEKTAKLLLKNQNKSFTNNRLVLQKFTLSKNSLTKEEKKVF